jgi:hypothetical protein
MKVRDTPLDMRLQKLEIIGSRGMPLVSVGEGKDMHLIGG